METDEEIRVWKALSDPTRRQLLTHLREGPQTTGALCALFSMSRFGVMKHLRLLTEAQLITVRRQGRERFNHLNAVPLQQIHQRFVRGFAAPSASRLLRLEQLIDSPEPPERNPMSDTNRSFHIAQEITYAASPEVVWKALTSDIGKWWGYHIGPDDSSITLDGRVGGLFIERWGDGEGELYATVTFMKKGVKISLVGGMGLTGPGTSKFSYALEPDGEGTKLLFDHYCHGHRGEDTEASFREGWSELLETSLRKWVEEGTPSGPSQGH